MLESETDIVIDDNAHYQPDMAALRKTYKVPAEQTQVSEYILNVVSTKNL
jgi:Cys-tRNA synthase (O-phospho-L-seryl-tRNA:Cys-tRNA synthase)